ncbi:YdbT family protein [Lacunimicrobium album]
MPVKSPSLMYRCPSCETGVSVAYEFIGKRVDCPSCGIPFMPRMPEATAAFDLAPPLSTELAAKKPSEIEPILREVHPAMFRQYPFIFGGLLLLAIVLSLVSLMFLGTGNYNVAVPCFLLVVCIAGYFGYWWLDTISTTLRVTTKRSTLRKGLVAKSTTEVQHDDVRNLQVYQSAWQRLLGVGNISISSSGQDELEIRVRGIANPDEIAGLVRSMQ